MTKKGINAEGTYTTCEFSRHQPVRFVFCMVQSTNDEVAAGEGEMIEHIQQTLQIICDKRSTECGLPICLVGIRLSTI